MKVIFPPCNNQNDSITKNINGKHSLSSRKPKKKLKLRILIIPKNLLQLFPAARREYLILLLSY